jgi:hypothetical protein
MNSKARAIWSVPCLTLQNRREAKILCQKYFLETRLTDGLYESTLTASAEARQRRCIRLVVICLFLMRLDPVRE